MLKMNNKLIGWLIAEGHSEVGQSKKQYRRKVAELIVDEELTTQRYLKFFDDEEVEMSDSPDPQKVFGGASINVKGASSKYSEKRYTAKNKAGETVIDPCTGQECSTQSEAAKARSGVLLKYLANRSGIVNNPLTEHEKALLDQTANEQKWCGKISSDFYDEITPGSGVKALIDDASSGGLEISPIEFDSDVISFPLLFGELYPHVDIKPVPRGRRVEGASIGTPTMSWGGADDSAIDIFNTASLVSAIDTTIYAIDGCIEVGRDFLADSPVNVGQTLTQLIGERLRNELDKVIANGNGTTQPEGLFQASGVSTVTADNGASGPPTLDDYLDLLFGIDKQYRKAGMRVAFISNDTSYQRSKAIKVDTASPSTDQRPVLSPLTQVNDYMTLGWNHRIENNLGNTVAGIAALAKYRLYRRMGLELRWETGGKELARRNMMLLVYRARFGGKLMDSNAFCKWTNGQS